MTSYGRLESRVTVPTGGWPISVAITAVVGSPFTVTIPAGNYFMTAFLTQMKTSLDAASGADGTFTVTGAWGDGGTGFVTISHTVETFTITWTTTNLRDLLGFTGTLTPAALTFTGTKAAQGVWMADVDGAFPYGSTDPGHYESDMVQTVSPGGTVRSFIGNTRTLLPPVRWSHVTKVRARQSADSTGTTMSFERWKYQSQMGGLSYFPVGCPVNIYGDATANTLLGDYSLVWESGGTEMSRVVEDWDGLYSVFVTGYAV